MHTPGPWILSTDKTCIYGTPIDGRNYGVVAKTTQYIDPRDDQVANAYLIAATPELLLACKVALDALGCDKTDQDRLEAQRVIHKAIEKSRTK